MAVLSFGLLAAPLFSSLLLSNLVAGLPSGPLAARNGAFTRQGCFSDSSPRIFAAGRIANDQMTVEACAAFCSTKPFFGLQYGRECYCSETAAPASLLIADTQCSFPCAGNSAQKCGAGMRMDVYTNDAYVPYSPPVIVGAPYLGCFADGTPRVLPERLISTTDMTVAKCSTHCAGYQYFGIEYGRECFCGDSAPSVPAPESECNMPCAGDPNTKCGAGMRLSVFGPVTIPPPPTTNPDTVAGFNYDGCYTDSTGLRVLDGPRTGGSTATLESCAAFCAAYTYFGTENGNECFCGNTLDASAAKKSETNCQKPCAGDGSLICGDANRLSLYKRAPPPPPSSSETLVSSVTSAVPSYVTSYDTVTSHSSTTPSSSKKPPSQPTTTLRSSTTRTTKTTPSATKPVTTTSKPAITSTFWDPETTSFEPTETTEGPVPSFVTSYGTTAPISESTSSLSPKTPPPPPRETSAPSYPSPTHSPETTTSSATPAPEATNMITQNPSFESGAWGWSFRSEIFTGETDYVNEPVHDGSVALVKRFSNTATSFIVFTQTMEVEAGQSYTASYWWRQTNPSAACTLLVWVDDFPMRSFANATTFAAESWNQLAVSFEATGVSSKIEGSAYCEANGAPEGEPYSNVIYFDDAWFVKDS